MQAPLDPVRWEDGALRVLDQRLLPENLQYVRLTTVEEVAVAIETLAVRGAPAIGIAAAYGVALAAGKAGPGNARAAAEAACLRLARTRPTAVNLFCALSRQRAVLGRVPEAGAATDLLEEAHQVLAEDLDAGRRIGEAGLAILPAHRPLRVLTHCNAGGLATGGWGTALAPVYAAVRRGIRVEVLADETRPLLQGSRLTAWELARAGIPVRVLVDGAAASALLGGAVDVVLVGADRIAANGDTANKIGTLSVALAAHAAGVPFYVAAPRSTFDLSLAGGAGIPVEERGVAEILGSGDRPGVGAWNPAFDITPARLIAGWITEDGLLRPPFFSREAGDAKSRASV